MTKEAIVDANFWQRSFLSGSVSVRSIFRRYAMATPASVHCMSRQLVFGDLSCVGTINPSPSTTSSHTGSSCALPALPGSAPFAPPGSSGFSELCGLTGSHLAASLPRTETEASHQSRFFSASCRCCARRVFVRNLATVTVSKNSLPVCGARPGAMPSFVHSCQLQS